MIKYLFWKIRLRLLSDKQLSVLKKLLYDTSGVSDRLSLSTHHPIILLVDDEIQKRYHKDKQQLDNENINRLYQYAKSGKEIIDLRNKK